MTSPSKPIPERVAARALREHDVNETGCWISRYSVSQRGYAQIGWWADGGNHMTLAHRAAWVAAHGQIPEDMTVDHRCKQTRCVNPAHLRLLSNAENARRNNGNDWPLGQCANGHELTDGRCVACRRLHDARYKFRRDHPGHGVPESLQLASEKAAA